MIYRLSGKLTIPESKYEYGLFENSTADIKYVSIDRFLNSIYMKSPTSQVEIEINRQSKFDKKTFEQILYVKGELFRSKNRNGIYDWHVGDYKSSVCVGDVLFYNIDEKVRVLIKDVDYKKYVTCTRLLQESLYGTPSDECCELY